MGGANYLQVVTKDTLEDQVGLSISIVRLAYRCGIQLASLKEIGFLFQMQLSAKFLVIFQLTISFLEVLRRQRIPLPTDPNTETGVIHRHWQWQEWHGCSQECKFLHCTFHTTVLCQSEICVGLRQFWAANIAAAVVAFAAVAATNAVTYAVSGIPTASQRRAKSEVPHLWAKWLRHPCRLGDPHRIRAGGKIRSGPQVGKVATSPLPSRGSPPLQSGGQDQKWPTCGQSGYVTPAVSGIPTASERGARSKMAHLWAKWLRHPCRLGDPHRFRAGGESEVAHK